MISISRNKKGRSVILMCKNKIKKALYFNVLCLLTALGANAETVPKPLDPAWEARFDKAEWVSLVHIESIHSLVNQSLSADAGMLAVQGYSYALTINQQWKTTNANLTKLRVDLSDCPLLLTLDGDYIVFARRNYRGQLQLDSCDNVVHATEAEAVINWLNNEKSERQAVVFNN